MREENLPVCVYVERLSGVRDKLEVSRARGGNHLLMWDRDNSVNAGLKVAELLTEINFFDGAACLKEATHFSLCAFPLTLPILARYKITCCFEKIRCTVCNVNLK